MLRKKTAATTPAANLTPELLRKFREVPEPHHYLEGCAARLSGLPRALLLFTRTRRQSLGNWPALHFRYVLICCLQGAGGVILDGRLHQLKPGECLLVFPHQSHYYTGLENEEPVWFFTTFEYAVAEELQPLRERVRRLQPEDLHLADRWREAFQAERFAECAGLVAGLLDRLLSRPERKALARSGRSCPASACASPGDPELIARVCAYVREHLRAGCRLDDVAAAAGLSESRLRAVFRQAVGLPLGEYIRRSRIYAACQLLADRSRNITQTAEECGFSSLYAFSRAFKQETGLSPVRFRRRAQAR